MKRVFIPAILSLFFLGSFVWAQDDQVVSTVLPTPDPDYWTEERIREAKPAGPLELVDPRTVGILPDSPFYFVKTLGEKIRGVFLFSEPARLKYQLKIAERRLNEAQALVQKGKSDVAAKTVEKYQDLSDRINKRMEDAVAKGRDLSEVRDAVIEARSKHIQILERVLERIPGQAKDAIQKVIESEREKVIPAAPGQRPSISWEDCIKIPGSKILPTFPEQCAAPDGRRAVSPPGWRWPETSPLPTPTGAGAVPGSSPVSSPIVQGGCKVTGCSGQVCSDQDVETSCEWKEEYACYKTARCERQQDGRCGWTMTENLTACFTQARQTVQ